MKQKSLVMKEMKLQKNFLIHLKIRHQNNLESMKSSELVLDYIQLLYYKCHKINMNSGGSYIDSSDWIKNEKATESPINEKDNNIITYSTL